MKKNALLSAVNSSYSGTCQGAYLFHTMLGLVVRPEQWLPDHCSGTTIKLLLMFWHNGQSNAPSKDTYWDMHLSMGNLNTMQVQQKNVSNKIY